MGKTSLFPKIIIAILVLLGSLAFLWLIVARILVKLADGGPCPYALAWMVDNPLRRRYMGQVLDRIGIQPGERVLELGPGPGAFTVGAARLAGP
ncbi:MAG: hypothetical protein KJ638_03980, partial [Chloroflexi bacterium]|nr:hypothetical protein [Chloroflexota bacterium]